MTHCGHRAVLLMTQDVADTSTSVARERIELTCDLPSGHGGSHRDSTRNESWEGEPGRRTTLLRHVTETSASTRSTLSPPPQSDAPERGGKFRADSAEPASADDFDCLTCGACCYQRPGTILVESADLVRWKRLDRQDILSQLEPGHFGQMAFAMSAAGCCVHHGTAEEPHACRIYTVRSETCIKFEAGSQQCREFRRDRSIGA